MTLLNSTSLFKPAETTSAYLKMGILGFAGSGKTKTASLTAIGLIQHMKERGLDYAEKPVFFLDTETGSDWVLPDFDKASIKLAVAKTRAFSDLLIAVKEAEANGSLLLVDSLSHFWKELCDSYQRRRAQQLKSTTYRLQFQDWAYLKGEWSKFTDAFVNSPLHMILCGRAGFEYDYFEDEDGKKQLEKTGIKMKAEGEMGYEPSLLVHMERRQKMKGNSVVKTVHTATILKDRSTLLDGKEFANPTFKSFQPHIMMLNLGGKHLGVDTSRTSEHAISADKRDWQPVQRKIVIDEIQTLLVLHIPGQAAADKQRKAQLIRQHFNASWTEIEEVMPLFDLRAGYDALHQELEGKPSRYNTAVIAGVPSMAAKPAINDALSDHSMATESSEEQQKTAKPASMKDKLLSEIPDLGTPQDCLTWGLQMSDVFETLGKKDKELVRNALTLHQAKLMNGAGTNAAQHR